MRLENKIGIVTAAASGMGRAGALRFAKEGAAVGVVDIDEAGVAAVVEEITAGGGRALGIVGDLRQDDFARDIVRRTANAFGGLDFVWDHVGHPGPAAIEGIDMADFELAIDLNLRTILVTTEAAIPELRARGGGALLYTASTSGLVGSQFSPVYSMAKFGVVGFVRALAKRLAPDGLLIMSTPNATGLSKLLMITIGEGIGQIPRGTHEFDRFIAPDRLKALLADAGLKCLDVEGIAWSPTRGLHLSEDVRLNYLVSAVAG